MKRDIPTPTNILLSYYYTKNLDLDELRHLTIIGDSGAFSAKTKGSTVDPHDLAEWGIKWKHRLKWVAALDVIGDEQATFANWRLMTTQYDLQPVPTIHYGANPRELDRYADHGVDFVGLGGLVQVHTTRQMRWLIQVFKYAKKNHPDMQFHGWGCTTGDHFRLPFYSVDSSSWTASFRYGRANIYDPEKRIVRQVKLDGRGVYQGSIPSLLANHYGIAPGAVAESSAANRDQLIRLQALSESAREQEFRRLHGPARAPRWGVNHADADRALHLATMPRDVQALNDERGLHLATAGPPGSNSSPYHIAAMNKETNE